MKKLLLVLAIGAFAACGDNTTDDTNTADTAITAPTVDTNTVVAPDTTATLPGDTTRTDSAAGR
jgi:hypothetical protein